MKIACLVALTLGMLTFGAAAPRTAGYAWPAGALSAPPANGSVTLPDGGDILKGARMGTNLGLGVDTSGHKHDWVKPSPAKDSLTFAYPGDPSWGAAFVTVGRARNENRPGVDMSAFNTLEIEVKGDRAGDVVYVGIKDAAQPDDGTEWKEKVTLTTDWAKHQFPLFKFVGADVHRLYVLCEFVFADSPTTVYVRRIQYIKNN